MPDETTVPVATADWTRYMTGVVKAAPTIEEGVLKLVQIIHNEFHNGSGKNNPLGVADELLEAGDAIVHAVVTNTPAGEPDPEAEVETSDEVGAKVE